MYSFQSGFYREMLSPETRQILSEKRCIFLAEVKYVFGYYIAGQIRPVCAVCQHNVFEYRIFAFVLHAPFYYFNPVQRVAVHFQYIHYIVETAHLYLPVPEMLIKVNAGMNERIRPIGHFHFHSLQGDLLGMRPHFVR